MTLENFLAAAFLFLSRAYILPKLRFVEIHYCIPLHTIGTGQNTRQK